MTHRVIVKRTTGTDVFHKVTEVLITNSCALFLRQSGSALAINAQDWVEYLAVAEDEDEEGEWQ